jgi:DNA-binding NarL/FixJ family response regulator
MEILIIDDDPEDTSFFCEVLNEVMPEANCTVENKCSDIAATLAKLQHPPELIFIDGLMFPISGKECLIQVRALTRPADTRIIIYSGSVSPQQIDEFKSLGADEVMLKANNYERLKSFLTKVVSRDSLSPL